MSQHPQNRIVLLDRWAHLACWAVSSFAGLATHVSCVSQVEAQSLAAAQSFSILAGTTATAAGTGSVINGDVGVSPGTTSSGFDATGATITPPFMLHENDGLAIDAQTATAALYTDLDTRLGCTSLVSELNMVTVGPGLYCFDSTAEIAATGNFTLDGAGTYIFQVGSALTANVDSTMTLINGADPCNVFWQVTSAATSVWPSASRSALRRISHSASRSASEFRCRWVSRSPFHEHGDHNAVGIDERDSDSIADDHRDGGGQHGDGNS